MVNKTLLDFLSQLGLNREESTVYFILIKKGKLTALSLSRETKISRTTIYRIIERLTKMGLVEEIIDEHRIMVKAADLHTLDFLVKQQETKAEFLRKTFPDISAFITQSLQLEQPETKVLFYRGKEGIEQMIWNTLRTEKECCSYTYRAFEEIGGSKLAERWQEEWMDKKLIFKEIYSDEYLKSMYHRDSERVRAQKNPFFISKYISSGVLNINHQIDIYNDVVGFYNWYEGEVFGVEIYNEKIADMQKQLFDMVWQRAKNV